jgi:hypothetical protein
MCPICDEVTLVKTSDALCSHFTDKHELLDESFATDAGEFLLECTVETALAIGWPMSQRRFEKKTAIHSNDNGNINKVIEATKDEHLAGPYLSAADRKKTRGGRKVVSSFASKEVDVYHVRDLFHTDVTSDKILFRGLQRSLQSLTKPGGTSHGIQIRCFLQTQIILALDASP